MKPVVFVLTVVSTIIFGVAASSICRSAEAVKPRVGVQILDYNGLQKLVAEQKGKVVVVDCWSTSCGPCIEAFPRIVALQKKYGPAKVACISLSFDFEGLGKPEDVMPDVLKFLEKQEATFQNILSSESSDELCKRLKLASIPAVYVYGRDGKLAKRFEGSKAHEEVGALVEKLVGAQ